MRHARQIVNRLGCIVDHNNKEAQWFSRKGARESGAYVLVPEGFNRFLGYPHGFFFATETPLLTLVAQRLV